MAKKQIDSNTQENSKGKLPWFRLYHSTVDDDKLRLLAFEDRWHFIALLCCKRKGVLDEEKHDLMIRRTAVLLGLSTRELEEVARRLSDVGLIDANTLQPTKWDDLQFASDSSSERVKKYRERKASSLKRYSNANVTVQDTDTDTDTDIYSHIKEHSSGEICGANVIFKGGKWHEVGDEKVAA